MFITYSYGHLTLILDLKANLAQIDLRLAQTEQNNE